MSKDMKLSVGQKLWYVPSSRRGEPRWVTVKSVGRKWAEIDYRERVDIEGLWVDGGQYSSPARCYLSAEEHQVETQLNNAWSAFRKLVEGMYRMPEGMTAERIAAACEALGVTPAPEPRNV